MVEITDEPRKITAEHYIEFATIDDDGNVELSFSDDQTLIRDRDLGFIVFDHSAGSADLTQLNSGRANTLLNHDPDNVMGRILSARVDRTPAGSFGRATVTFAATEKALEIKQLVDDGILTGVSMGTHIFDFEQEGDRDGIPVHRITAWRPIELSFTPIPRNQAVGVNLADTVMLGSNLDPKLHIQQGLLANKIHKPQEVSTMSEDNKDTNDRPEVDVNEYITQGADRERERVSALFALGAKHNVMDKAQEFANDRDKTPDHLRTFILDNLPKEVPAVKSTANGSSPVSVDLNLTRQEVQRYSLMRAINAEAKKDWSNAGYEREVSQEIARLSNAQPTGLFVPAQAFQTFAVDRTSGAGLIGTELDGNRFVDFLRPLTVMDQLGVQTIDGLVGNFDFPKQTASGTVGWIDPDAADAPATEPTFGTVQMSPKHVAGRTTVTRSMQQQSTPGVENLVRNNLLRNLANALDRAIFQGTGSNGQPTGIVNMANVGTVSAYNANDPTFLEVLALQGALNSANVASDSRAFVAPANIVQNMKGKPKATNQAIFVYEDGSVAGDRTVQSNNAPGLIYGNFSNLVVGSWGTLDVVVDAVSSNRGGIDLKAFLSVDIAAEHEEAFSIFS